VEWLSLLPPDLAKAAYCAGDEMAWPRSDAIRVVGLLRANGYIVLGVDVWLPTQPGPTIPTPFVYDWSLNTDGTAKVSDRTAADFIRGFQWSDADESHCGMEPVFNITAKRSDA
jgi:hypothetical protein